MFSGDFMIPPGGHDTAKAYLQGSRASFEISDAGDGWCCISIFDATKKQVTEIARYLVVNCDAYEM